jgi:hypothetical protein
MAEFAIPTNQREFRCDHCDRNILVPRDLPPTTGPCPICGGIITSPAVDTPVAQRAEFQIPPTPAVAAVTPAPETKPATASRPEIPVAPVPVKSESTPQADLPNQEPTLEPDKPNKHPVPKPRRRGLIPAMLVLLSLFLLGGTGVFLASQELGRNVAAPALKVIAGNPAEAEANYIRTGWQKDAFQLLDGYLAASTTKDKLPFVLNGKALATKIEGFYGDHMINDSDAPADAFSVYELTVEDRERGLFRMDYDQPPQSDIKDCFRPLASLEVQYDLDENEPLLGTLARAGNTATEPLRVRAFFKRTPEGLKLDWEIFTQTKYRTLRNFVELPEAGLTGIFRVLLVEDVPEKGRAVAGTRTYRVADPANNDDNARINVQVDSETGRALSVINWRGTQENLPLTRTATVELKWSGSAAASELEINRLVCWEFLGLGGQETPVTASTK